MLGNLHEGIRMKGLLIFSIFFYFLISPLWAKNLTIGTIGHAPPFEYQDQIKGLAGFDIDIMNTLCQRMNTHCTFKIYEFSQLFTALKKGEVDLAIASIVITPKRQEQFLFSLPYKIARLQFITLKKNNFQETSQLINKRIGVYKNAPDRRYIEEKFNNQVTFQDYDHVENLFSALKKNEVDAILVESPRAEYWLANVPGFKMLGKSFPVGEGYGIAANLREEQLIQEINTQLKKMEKEDTYLKIYKLYF